MKLFEGLVCGLQPSTNIKKNSILGIVRILDPPLKLYNVVKICADDQSK